MNTEIMSNASDAYRQIPFYRQAVSWDQSDLSSPPGQKEVYTTSEETIVLVLSCHMLPGLFQPYFILCNCSGGTKVKSYLKQTWANWRSRGQQDLSMTYIFVCVQNQIPQSGGTDLWEVEHLSELVCVDAFSLQECVEDKNGRSMIGTPFSQGRK